MKNDILKRTLAAVSAAALMLCFTACGGSGKEASESGASEAQASASPTVSATAEPEMISVKMATIGNITGTLNIRSEPNTDCEILGSAKAGDKFEVLTENCQEGWHEISYEGGKAYVSAEFTTVAEEQQAAPTPTPDPNAPIIVNGSGRAESSESSTSEGMTTETIVETEDPARR